MSQMREGAPGKWPRWVMIVGSIAIVFHLLAIASGAMNSQSSPPWLSDESRIPPTPPFAQSLYEQFEPAYLKPLVLGQNYHFASNEPRLPEVYFVAKLKDAEGREMAVIRIPDPDA